MPNEPSSADLLTEIQALRQEVKELQRKQVPGQLTGTLDEGDTRFWSFTDKNGYPVLAEDAQTGYGLSSPLTNPSLYYSGMTPMQPGGYTWPNVQDGVAWDRHWFGYIPNVNPYVGMSFYIDIVGQVIIDFRIITNGNLLLWQAGGLTARTAWYNTPPIKFQQANPGEVSFLAIDVRAFNPAAEICRYSFGGVYGLNSLS